jgi:diguanylate cyclase (GGDEF)-like protein/putative nucleotidyltransferase with HDIG domain
MTLNERLFIIIPLIALLCNIFLVLTVLTAHKDHKIDAFIELLVTFTAWCMGSLFMRMTLYPGPVFWYQVSITGIFLVPFFIYNFMYCFTDSKGSFVRTVLFISWVTVSVLNLSNIFITNPEITTENGERRFEYGISAMAVIPVILAALTIWGALRLARSAVKEGRTTQTQLRPLFIGVLIMFIGTVGAILPAMVSLPIDTFACGINACCLYYALYKKRLVQLRGFAGGGPAGLMSILSATILFCIFYQSMDDIYTHTFNDYIEYETIVFAVFFSLLVFLIYKLMRWLMGNLFVRPYANREAQLRQFSTSVNQTLKLDEILRLYSNFLRDVLSDRAAFIFLRDSVSGDYVLNQSTLPLTAMDKTLRRDIPLAEALKTSGAGISYDDFTRMRTFRSMWDSEKAMLVKMKASFLLPVISEGELIAITVVSEPAKGSQKCSLSQSDISCLESMSAVLAMALKNASLYSSIENKARRDALTGLFNRGYFEECIRRDFEICRHENLSLLMISFDDFRLYNELYGTQEGDRILCRFGEILRSLVGTRGTLARYSGKEYAISLPFNTAAQAYDLAEKARSMLGCEMNRSGEKLRRFLTISAGICAYPASASSVEELFTYTGMALYSAKSGGKNRTVLYSPESGGNIDVSFAEKKAVADSCTATIYALTAAIDAKDHYTFAHSNHVAEYASELAAAIPLDAEHVEIIRQAGLLHDIGKIGIPEAILTKTDKLTKEEYEIIKQHVERSIAMIRYLPSLDYVIPSAIGHHERWDGHGYPRGISGEAIPIGARCLCIADSFDAMISKRSYKEAMSVNDALNEIRKNLGTQFDPRLGQLFIKLVENGTIKCHTSEKKSDADETNN